VCSFQTGMEFITHCHEAGAKIVIGSHTRSPFADSGYAYLRKMELLVDAGMTPLEVITAATKNGAEFFGIEDRLGTIEVGKKADLVLIEGEPDEDIGNMRNVRSVILNGRLVYEKN
jgi:imidazolonepropionase-like amidohydrolase